MRYTKWAIVSFAVLNYFLFHFVTWIAIVGITTLKESLTAAHAALVLDKFSAMGKAFSRADSHFFSVTPSADYVFLFLVLHHLHVVRTIYCASEHWLLTVVTLVKGTFGLHILVFASEPW